MNVKEKLVELGFKRLRSIQPVDNYKRCVVGELIFYIFTFTFFSKFLYCCVGMYDFKTLKIKLSVEVSLSRIVLYITHLTASTRNFSGP